MLYHAYQFTIQKYEILRMNEINPREKRYCIYCRRDYGKEYKIVTDDNTTEV